MTTQTATLNSMVLETVSHHTGRENAIKAMDVAHSLSLRDDRIIQQAIRILRREGHPILSTCQRPYGYYIPETWNEVQDCLASMKHRLVEDALTRRDIKTACGLYFAGAEKVRLL